MSAVLGTWRTWVRSAAARIAMGDGSLLFDVVLEPIAVPTNAPQTDRTRRERYTGAVVVFLVLTVVVRLLLSPARVEPPPAPRDDRPVLTMPAAPTFESILPSCDPRYTPRHMAHPDTIDSNMRQAVEYALRARMRASTEHPCLSATDLCIRQRVIAVRGAAGADITFLYNPRVVEHGAATDAFVLPALAAGLPARAVSATGVITVADAIGAHEYSGARAACIEHAIRGWGGTA